MCDCFIGVIQNSFIYVNFCRCLFIHVNCLRKFSINIYLGSTVFPLWLLNWCILKFWTNVFGFYFVLCDKSFRFWYTPFLDGKTLYFSIKEFVSSLRLVPMFIRTVSFTLFLWGVGKRIFLLDISVSWFPFFVFFKMYKCILIRLFIIHKKKKKKLFSLSPET